MNQMHRHPGQHPSQHQPNPQASQVPPAEEMDSESTGSRKSAGVIAAIVIVIVLLIFAYVARSQGWLPKAGATMPDPKLYQATFLINGQVYFGKISKITDDALVLEDVYYLQVVQPLQQQPPAAAAGVPAQQAQSDQPQLNLVKMGSEIHGPNDKMIIPKTSVVFWEDIKSDGTVGRAITEFKNRQQQ